MEIDTPLDDVIAKKRQEKRGSQRGKRNSRTSSGGRSVSTTSQKARGQAVANVRSGGTGQPTAVAAQPTQALPSDSSKIMVSNLPEDVSEPQVKELFESTIGPVKSVRLSFTSNGKSTGQATIEFRRGGDGSKACNQYNGRLIDNRRPMKVEILVDPARIPKPPLSTRVAPPPKQEQPKKQQQQQSEEGSTRRGKGKGRGRGGRRGGGGGSERPAVTAEELDAQMDAYVGTDATPSAPAA